MRTINIIERRKRYTHFVDVEVDVRLDELPTEDLLAELRDRGERTAKDADHDWRETLIEIADVLRADGADAAALLIERTLAPKWPDPETAQKKYDELKQVRPS